MAIVKTVNAEGGSDARYDVSQMTPEERANFDGEGRPLGVGFPEQDTWTPGLPGARGGTGPGDMGGGYSGGGGGDPYDSYIQQLQSMLNSQSAGQSADTKAAIQQALISYGVVPQGFEDKFGALDDTTRALIQKNTDTGISGYARMLQDKEDAQRQMLAGLSAKGLRRSGAKGWLGRRAQLNWDRQSADATNALLSDIGGKTRAFADSEQQRKMQLLQALAAKPQTSPWQIGQQAMANAQPAPWFQVSTPTATVPQALQSYQTAWDANKNTPGFADYWAKNTSPVAPSQTLPGGGSIWGKVTAHA